MGKGSIIPRRGYNQKLYDQNFDGIDFSSTRKRAKENKSKRKETN
jgi:hypothetical protein